MNGLYELERLDRRLSIGLDQRRLSIRAAAREIGLSPATVHRILSGRRPDVESYLIVRKWLDRNGIYPKKPQP